MFDQSEFITKVSQVDTSSNDITAAEINALCGLFYAAPDRSSGLWDVIIHSFQCGFLKASERP